MPTLCPPYTTANRDLVLCAIVATFFGKINPVLASQNWLATNLNLAVSRRPSHTKVAVKAQYGWKRQFHLSAPLHLKLTIMFLFTDVEIWLIWSNK